MKKILIICGNGLGSSLIIEMNVKRILNKIGKQAQISHTDLTSAKSQEADLYLGSNDILSNLDDSSRNVFGLSNLIDNRKIEEIIDENI